MSFPVQPLTLLSQLLELRFQDVKKLPLPVQPLKLTTETSISRDDPMVFPRSTPFSSLSNSDGSKNTFNTSHFVRNSDESLLVGMTHCSKAREKA